MSLWPIAVRLAVEITEQLPGIVAAARHAGVINHLLAAPDIGADLGDAYAIDGDGAVE